MKTLPVWFSCIALGVTLCYGLGSVTDAWSNLAAAGVILMTFLITGRFKVAGASSVSKMHTAWFTHQLRLMVWRMLLTLVLAGLVFRLTWPTWGIAFWLSIAAYYQVGLILHLREIRHKATTLKTTIEA